MCGLDNETFGSSDQFYLPAGWVPSELSFIGDNGFLSHSPTKHERPHLCSGPQNARQLTVQDSFSKLLSPKLRYPNNPVV